MATRKNTFGTKGELSLAEGRVYETKKQGKEEVIVPIDFFKYLKEFDGKNITISITENIEIGEDEENEEPEEEIQEEEEWGVSFEKLHK